MAGRQWTLEGVGVAVRVAHAGRIPKNKSVPFVGENKVSGTPFCAVTVCVQFATRMILTQHPSPFFLRVAAEGGYVAELSQGVENAGRLLVFVIFYLLTCAFLPSFHACC